MNAQSVAHDLRQGIIPPFAMSRDAIRHTRFMSLTELECTGAIHEHALQHGRCYRNTPARLSRVAMGSVNPPRQRASRDWFLRRSHEQLNERNGAHERALPPAD